MYIHIHIINNILVTILIVIYILKVVHLYLQMYVV